MGEAITVAGDLIGAEARSAAIAAMVGQFKARDVRAALSRHGVQNTDRAADRIMQAERKAGRIRAINNRTWERAL